MPSNMKISLLALAGSVAAIPHAHNHMHVRHDKYNYTFAPVNGTAPAPTASGAVGEHTTVIDATSTSTTTVVSTIVVPRPSAEAGVSKEAAPEVCGPPTVYVTATEKVTVTVPAGGVPSASAVPSKEAQMSILPVPSKDAEVQDESSSYIIVSSTQPAEPVEPAPTQPSSYKPVEVPSAEPSEVPSSKPVEVPSSSAAPVPSSTKPAEVPSPTEPAEVPSSSAAPTPVEPSSSSSAPSSEPSKPASGGATYSGSKRGIAYRWDGAADAKSIATSFKPGFAWNWEADSRGDIGDTPFIPTLRTMENAGDWPSKVKEAIKSGSKVVFGFNEPDVGSQANMDPATACQNWKDLMNPIKDENSDVEVVGPSVSSDVAEGKGLSWLKAFKEQCPDAKYDSINIHWYGYGSAGFKEFKEHVDNAVSQNGRVWVTEFGLHGQSVEASTAFLEEALPYLDSLPECAGYSYFAVGSFDMAYNMLGSGSSLTETGKIYVAQ